MVPMWMFPLAIACGNTFVLKPSEKVPLTANRLAQLFLEAGLPAVNALRDGSGKMPTTGFFMRPVFLDGVTAEAEIFQQEIFGPVLAMMHAINLDEALHWTKLIPYGNGATIFTQNGYVARRFSQEVPCGMVGVNVGVPAPMSQFAFSGWNQSFFGDLHVQGIEGAMFYTRQKTVLTRWDNTYFQTEGW
jgi:malonate-semialdehyde dehydrogenase (acetylating) / methylmalonate-semialdehyde dehydrogenase